MSESYFRFAGWTAYADATLSIAILVSLAALGYLIGAFTGPIWAIWARLLLLNGKLTSPTFTSIGGSS
jgi:hypothetical protein